MEAGDRPGPVHPVLRALERVRYDGCANALIASAILKKLLIEIN